MLSIHIVLWVERTYTLYRPYSHLSPYNASETPTLSTKETALYLAKEKVVFSHVV